MEKDVLSWLEKLSNNEVSLEELKEKFKKKDDQSNSVERVEDVEPMAESKPKGKEIKILIDSSDGDKVRVNLPVNFAKGVIGLGRKFGGKSNLADYNVDVDALIEMLDQGHIGELVDITSKEGDRVKIVVV